MALCWIARPALLALSLSWAVSLAAQPAQPPISDAVLQQIRSLITEKESRSPAEQKVDSQLLYAGKMRKGLPIAPGINKLETNIAVSPAGNVTVDVDAFALGKPLLKTITALGGEVLYASSELKTVRASIPLDRIVDLATEPAVRFIAPAAEGQLDRVTDPAPRRSIMELPVRRSTTLHSGFSGSRVVRAANVARQLIPILNAVNVSAGFTAHRVNVAETSYGATGAGIKIGVLSDSVDGLAAVQASGDLGPVTVLPGESGVPGSGEGTAMLEIVHDLAPDAELYFATAFGGTSSFASNIQALRTAGCDIIIDDVFYFNESPFQDGPIAQAVNTVTAAGALYFSSAGNAGSVLKTSAGVYEGDFVDGGALALTPGGNVNLFNDGITTGTSVQVTQATTRVASLFWSDPIGASSNDYDLFVVDSAMTAIKGSSTNVQNGAQDPYEQPSFMPLLNDRLIVLKKTGAAVRFLHLNGNRARFNIRTTGQTKGHSAAVAAFGVAAVAVASASGGAFSAGNTVEFFSSDGPRRIYYNADGTLANSGNPSLLSDGGIVRQKPDITAADGVATATPGFNPFFGTSAAAPHAGAIAALVKSSLPAATPAQIRTALTSSAIDITAAGVDINSGAGIVMADSAITAIGGSARPFLNLGTVTTSQTTGNGNGVLDPGENGSLTIAIQNTPPTSATSVNATLTTSTAGVTIINGTSAYPAIAGASSATNTTPFTFSVAPSVACGAGLQFTLTVTYVQSPASRILTFSVPIGAPGPPVTVSYTGPAVPIPDGTAAETPGALLSVPLAVSGFTGGGIADLNFRLDGTACSTAIGSTTVGLDHSWVGDLVISLTSPHGTTVKLIDRMLAINNNGHNFCNTVLDDSGASSIQTVSAALAPFTGTFNPANPLSAFNGEDPNGTWTLTAQDFYNGDTGSVRAFSLVITPTVCTASDAVVTITANDPTATEAGTTTGQFTVSRTGPTTSSLSVNFSIGGTAANGTDYNTIASPVTIPGGSSSTTITITPIDEAFVELDETVVLTVTAGTGYSVGSPSSATVTITSDEVVPPANVVATAQSSTSVGVTWGGAPAATQYEIWRAFDGAPSTLLTTLGVVTSYTDSTVIAGHTYVYRARTLVSAALSGFSNSDLATTVIFTDDALVAGTTSVKAVHLTEVRTAVNAVRVSAGLGPMTWISDPSVIAGTTLIRKAHIDELRGALTPALTTLGFSAPSFTDPTLATGDAVKAAHVQELRNAVK